MTALQKGTSGTTMRKLLKFGHQTAITFLGSVSVVGVPSTVASTRRRARGLQRSAIGDGEVASLVLMPSLLISLLFGLASMAVVPGFHGAPWAWGKLVTTVLMLEGSLLGIQSPIKREAELAVAALTNGELVGELAQKLAAEQWSLILIGLVATANVALGVWRPRFRSRATPAS